MEQYLSLVVLAVLAILFAAFSFLASKLLAPRRSTPEKSAPYECGIIPGRNNPERFPVKFYLIAMLFIIFDIEIIFIYPWAVDNEALGATGFYAILIFSALVFESFIYLISKGALDWGPTKVLIKQDIQRSAVSDSAKSETKVKTIGLEGREVQEAK